MRSPARPLELSELIDLELRFAADRDLDAKQLRLRDERIGRELASNAVVTRSRHELFRRWLAALREDRAPTPGEQVQAGYRLLGVILVVVALLLGAGAARAVLAYDGSQPVNVVHFLAVFVAAQLVLVALAVIAMVPQLLGRWSALGPLQESLRTLTYRRSQASGARFPRPLPAQAWARLGGLSSVYGRVERWMLFALVQRTAFFFNAGALFTCFYLITFTDLAFAWSTTLDVDAATMTRLLGALSSPWIWLDAAVPTPDLVAASRYFRNSGSYDPRMLKDWWAFLLAALVTYGLLPRLLLWTAASWRTRRCRSLLALDHGDAQVAYERLTRSTHGWSGHGLLGEDADTSSERSRTPAAAPTLSPLTAGGACTVIRWADVPLSPSDAAALALRRFGWRAETVHDGGGRNGLGRREELIEVLSRESPERPLVVLAEAWEAPSRALTGLLAELRKALGPRRPLVIGLLDTREGRWSAPTRDDREVWDRVVGALADPYARVENMIAE